MSAALRYAEVRMWFEGEDPLVDPPREVAGVIQTGADGAIDPERSAEFAAAVVRAHAAGECGCQA